MTTHRYLATLRSLGLTPASQRTAALLGLSLRHCQRLSAGASVPRPVELLLAMYVAHGVPASADR